MGRRISRPPTGTAFEAGLRLLARRAHSRAELARKLERRGFDPEDVAAAMRRLAAAGYLDESAFARGLVRRRSASRGSIAVSSELAAKGIGRAGVAEAMAELSWEDQLATARRLAERMCRSGAVLDYQEMLHRVGARLARRGFPAGIVRAACRAALAERKRSAEA